MRVLVINQNNIIQDGQNNKLVYKFPNSVVFKNNYIAVSSITMYYSWFNITSTYQNNKFTYIWYTAAGPIPFDITIPDGLYEISTLNQLLQFECIKNGTYLINAAGQNSYYMEFLVNPSRYAVQINTFNFPTSLPVGFTLPPNWVGSFPVQSFNPSIIIPKNLNIIFGYPENFTTDPNLNNAYVPPTSTYIAKNGAGTLSYLSTSAPNLQPNSSIYVSMSNINNSYSQPSSIIYSIIPTVAVGEIITERPPQFMWNKLIDGTYNELRMTFLGTDFQQIKINDPQMTILLTIKDIDEPFSGKN